MSSKISSILSDLIDLHPGVSSISCHRPAANIWTAVLVHIPHFELLQGRTVFEGDL